MYLYLYTTKTKVMKKRIIVSAILIMILSAGIASNASAAPWRGGCRHGWYGPHVGVRVWAPVIPVPVIAPPVVYGGYYGPRYFGYRGGYYAHPHYYAHGGYSHYGHRYYGPRH